MWPDVVVVVSPQGQLAAGTGQAVEDLLIQAVVAQATIEGLEAAVLLRLARIASLIETCKINDIEHFAYLKATLTAIANGHPQSRIDDLLPWNFPPSR